MKISPKITYLLLIIVIIFSCDKVDELTDFDVTGDFETTVTVDITEDSQGAAISFEESKTIDIASDDRIQENLDLIEKVSIESLTYKFANYNLPEVITISDASISAAGMTIDIEDVDIAAAASAGTVYTVTNTSFLQAIESSLENQPEVTLTFEATISSSPVAFDLIVTLDTTVTIDAI